MKKKHFTIEEAAAWLGEPVERTRLRVRNKELPFQGSRIPARSLLNLYYNSVLNQNRPSNSLTNEASANSVRNSSTQSTQQDVGIGTRLYGRRIVSEAAHRLDKTWKQIDQMIADGELTLDPVGKRLIEYDHNLEKASVKQFKEAVQEASNSRETRGVSQTVDAARHSMQDLENEVAILKEKLRAEKEHWERELEREREGRKQDNRDAQYEIDQLDAELENLH